VLVRSEVLLYEKLTREAPLVLTRPIFAPQVRKNVFLEASLRQQDGNRAG